MPVLPRFMVTILCGAALLAATGAQQPPSVETSTLSSTPPQDLGALPGSGSTGPENFSLFPDPLATGDPKILSAQEDRPWKVYPHVAFEATFDSNIFIQNEDTESDLIFTLSPGVAIGRGNFRQELLQHWSFRERFQRDRLPAIEERRYIFLDYTPSVSIFTNNSSENSFDQDIVLEGQYQLRKVTLGVRARYQDLNVADIDLGDRVRRRFFSGALTGEYEVTEKTSLELNAYNFLRDYDKGTDSAEYRLQAWFNYLVQPKTRVSIGAAGGYIDVDKGSAQRYEQALIRVRYRATEKITVNGTAGVEFRQVDGDGDDRTNFVFSVGGTYQPFDGTFISLDAYRRTVTSATSSGTNYELTGVEGQVRQRLFQRYYATLAGGYRNSEYVTSGRDGGAGSERTDNLFYVRPSIGFDLTRYAFLELGAEFKQNSSSSDRRSFDQFLVFVQIQTLF